MNKYERLNKIQIVSFAFLTIAFIVFICGIDEIKDVFWMCIGANLSGNLYFTNKWANEGRTWYKKMDKNYSKNFTRKPSDILFFINVIYFVLTGIIIVVGNIFKNGTLMMFLSEYLVVIICNILGIIIVDKTKEEVFEFVDRTGKGKIEIKNRK